MQPSTVESADRCVKSEWALKEQIFLYKYKEGQDLPLHSSTFCSQLDDVANKNQAGAVVVAQLPERLLLIPKTRGLNPVIGEFVKKFYLTSNVSKNKEKEVGDGPFLKKYESCNPISSLGPTRLVPVQWTEGGKHFVYVGLECDLSQLQSRYLFVVEYFFNTSSTTEYLFVTCLWFQLEAFDKYNLTLENLGAEWPDLWKLFHLVKGLVTCLRFQFNWKLLISTTLNLNAQEQCDQIWQPI